MHRADAFPFDGEGGALATDEGRRGFSYFPWRGCTILKSACFAPMNRLPIPRTVKKSNRATIFLRKPIDNHVIV